MVRLVAEKSCFLYGLISNGEVRMAMTAAIAYLAAFGAIDLDGIRELVPLRTNNNCVLHNYSQCA
jgi:hypothetical protein